MDPALAMKIIRVVVTSSHGLVPISGDLSKSASVPEPDSIAQPPLKVCGEFFFERFHARVADEVVFS